MKIKLIGLILITQSLILTGQNKSGILQDTVHLKEITVSTAIPLNNKQIEKFYKTNYFSTIDNLTSHLEGFSLIKRGEYAMEPQLNGFSGGQLNITISGMKMFGACTDKMDPVTSYIEPVNLKSITIEHGTTGSLYGSNVGGSVNLELQEPERGGLHPFYSALSFGYESASSGRNVLFSAGNIKKKFEWALNGVYRKNDRYISGSGNRIPFSQFEKSNIHSVVRYLPDSVTSLKADVLYDIARNVGYPALSMDVSKARATIFAIEFNRIMSSYKLTAKVYYNSVYHVMDDSHRDSLFIFNNKVDLTRDSVIMRMKMPGRSDTYGSFIQAEVRLNSRNQLLVKADNYVNSSLAEMTMFMHYIGRPAEPPMYLQTWPDIKRSVTGLFIQNTTRFNRKISLTVNVRLDYNSDKLMSDLAAEQFSVLNYRLSKHISRFTHALNASVQYRISKPFILSLQTGISERIPTISEQYGYFLFNAYDGYDYIGKPDLKTEKSISARAALTYFYRNLKINVSQSFNYLSDYIMGVTNNVIPPLNFYTNGLRVYDNLPEAVLRSTDLQLMYSPGDHLSVFNLTKFTYGKLSSGIPIPLIPPLKNIVSVSYDRKKWTFQIDNEIAAKQNRINNNYGETISQGYVLFNVKINYHIVTNESRLDLGAGITNLFNESYYEHLDWGHIPRQGRSLNLFIRYKY